jgi:membrane-bound lytic murein transglycosylase D
MPATGRDFSLRQNVFRDDRRDVLASTRAALDYLTRLHAQFGHWHLALAAYNWGEGNVQRAITRNQRSGLPTDYESLRMPDETRRYVPKLLAVKALIADPARFGLVLPPLENHPYFLSVPIERDMDVKIAATLAGIELAEFEALNPQQNKPVILAAGTPRILLPYDNAERFLRALERYEGPWASWTAWQAPRTVRVSEAARLIGMPEADLRTLNRIPPGMMIRQGSTLLVPRARDQDDVSERLAETATIALQREPVPKRAVKASTKGTTKGRTGTTVAGAPAIKPSAARASTSKVTAQNRPASKPAHRANPATRVAAGPKSTQAR